ncbi:MAG: DegT/DnrJ/EryC1/StrS family aminotransferase [Planctomycetes bacterium]|nr:DegT/DnrJ/EryC1/StrS family aminotransferase [Planctomycetota bacterium]
MKVKTKDYARQYETLWPELEPLVRSALFEDDPVLGRSVAHFEEELAAFHAVRHAIGVGSGTDALVLTLQALGVRDQQVLTNAHTFPGVVSAILLAGGEPVLVEPDRETGRPGAEHFARHLSARTGAILAVHLYGHPLDLPALSALTATHGIPLVEDCAQAHGALVGTRPVGSFGRASTLSFHPSKNLGAFGDGGAILTNDEALAQQLRIQRNLGKRDKYAFQCVAPNTKLDTLQAVLLRLKLRHLPSWLTRRRAIAARYLDALADLDGLMLPVVDRDTEPAWHLFVIRTEERDALREALAASGVRTGLHYPIAVPDHPAFQARFANTPCPIAREWARTVVSLPLSHEHEDQEIEHVIRTVRTFFETPRS